MNPNALCLPYFVIKSNVGIWITSHKPKLQEYLIPENIPFSSPLLIALNHFRPLFYLSDLVLLYWNKQTVVWKFILEIPIGIFINQGLYKTLLFRPRCAFYSCCRSWLVRGFKTINKDALRLKWKKDQCLF